MDSGIAVSEGSADNAQSLYCNIISPSHEHVEYCLFIRPGDDVSCTIIIRTCSSSILHKVNYYYQPICNHRHALHHGETGFESRHGRKQGLRLTKNRLSDDVQLQNKNPECIMKNDSLAVITVAAPRRINEIIKLGKEILAE